MHLVRKFQWLWHVIDMLMIFEVFMEAFDRRLGWGLEYPLFLSFRSDLDQPGFLTPACMACLPFDFCYWGGCKIWNYLRLAHCTDQGIQVIRLYDQSPLLDNKMHAGTSEVITPFGIPLRANLHNWCFLRML